MTRRMTMVLGLAAATLMSPAWAAAHPGHEHKVMGTITMVSADHVMLKDRDGKDVAVMVTRNTQVKSKPAMKVEEIKAGTRVVVTVVEEKDKSLTAKTIEVGAAEER